MRSRREEAFLDPNARKDVGQVNEIQVDRGQEVILLNRLDLILDLN